MSRPPFPGLGFDPTPGDHAAVQNACNAVKTTMAQVMAVQSRLSQALDVTDDWSGDAADDFHDYGDDLPHALESGRVSAEAAGKALTAWGAQMVGNQDIADALEELTVDKKRELARTQAEFSALVTAPVSSTSSAADTARANAVAKARELDRLQAEVDALIAEAHKLEEAHLAQANAAAAAITSGKGDAFETEGTFGKIMNTATKVLSYSSLATAAIGATLILTGAGGPAGMALMASAVSGAASTASGIAAKLAKADGAPGWWSIGLSAVPPGKVLKGAGVAVKGAKDANLLGKSGAGLKGALKATDPGQQLKKFRDGVDPLKAARKDAAEKVAARTGREIADVTPAEIAEQAKRLAVANAASSKADVLQKALQDAGVPGAENTRGLPGSRSRADLVASLVDSTARDVADGGLNDEEKKK